jgi:hypothetical protein
MRTFANDKEWEVKSGDTTALRKRTLSPVRLVLKVTFFCSTHYPLYDFDLRATHARTLLPAALASVSFGFVLVRVRVAICHSGVSLYFGEY